jgi:hypothetical protein
MPLFSEQDETSTASLSYLLKMAFKNYETSINKYETLLVETTALNVSIKEKLSKIPDQDEVEQIAKDFIDKADSRIKQQQDKLDISENINKNEKEDLIRNLNNTIKTLLYKLNIVLAWLAILTAVGSAAFGYIELSMKSNTKNQTQTIIDTRGPTNKQNIKLYWVDDKGIRRYIQTEEHNN